MNLNSDQKQDPQPTIFGQGFAQTVPAFAFSQFSSPTDGKPSSFSQSSTTTPFPSTPLHFQSSQIASPSSINAGSKRSKCHLVESSKVDDFMGQLCSELDKICTVNEDSRDTEDVKLQAFTQVFQCPLQEATFFLEMSSWDLETAVMLWIESNESSSQTHSAPFQSNLSAPILPKSTFPSSTTFPIPTTFPSSSTFPSKKTSTSSSLTTKHIAPRTIDILGMPPGWVAQVNGSGRVQFFHRESGFTQYEIPPEFEGWNDDEIEEEEEEEEGMNAVQAVDVEEDQEDREEEEEEQEGILVQSGQQMKQEEEEEEEDEEEF